MNPDCIRDPERVRDRWNNMGNRFISNGLASARRLTPADKEPAQPQPNGTAASVRRNDPSTTPKPAAAALEADLDSLLKKEHARLQEELLLKERAEFHKHRQEVLPELRDVIANQQASLQSLELQVETLLRVHQELEEAAIPAEGPVSLAELRTARRNLDTARLELLKLQRDQIATAPMPAEPAATAPATFPAAGLTFKQATRLGLSLTWPLVAALLLGALFIGVCLLAKF
jgi:hypothetical protein